MKNPGTGILSIAFVLAIALVYLQIKHVRYISKLIPIEMVGETAQIEPAPLSTRGLQQFVVTYSYEWAGTRIEKTEVVPLTSGNSGNVGAAYALAEQINSDHKFRGWIDPEDVQRTAWFPSRFLSPLVYFVLGVPMISLALIGGLVFVANKRLQPIGREDAPAD